MEFYREKEKRKKERNEQTKLSTSLIWQRTRRAALGLLAGKIIFVCFKVIKDNECWRERTNCKYKE